MKTRGVLIVLVLASLLKAQSDSVIITEIMFYPLSGNNEYVELYNLSKTQSVDLSGYSVKYYTSLPDTIISAGSGTLLPPESYAVIMEGDYDFANGIYRDIIPPSALKLKINNNSFGSNGMANTASRPVLLLKSEGETGDSIFYSADNAPAISDEKKLLSPDTSSLLWSNCMLQNGTPGFRNSVMLYSNNIKAICFYSLPAIPVSGDDVELVVKIMNNGIETAGSFSVKFFYDADNDSVPSLQELLYSELRNQLNPGDTVSAFYTLTDLPAGSYNFIVLAEYPPDEFPADNAVYGNITVIHGNEPNSVIINEIMYAPQNSQPEWIEIYNNTGENINLKNWAVGDAVSAYYITADDFILTPGSFAVLTKDSSLKNFYPFSFSFLEVSLPSLNNTGDAVILLDSWGRTADTLYYFPDWGGSLNRSLERIDPASSSVIKNNWSSSVNRYRATPGFINSVTPKNIDAAVADFKTAEQYGICGDYVNFNLSAGNMGKNIIGDFNLSVYHDMNADSVISPGEEIRSFTAGEILPGGNADFRFSFNHFIEGNNYFIAKIHFNDDDTCNNISFFKLRGISVDFGRNDILINEIMYAPQGEPEWLEIVNNSQTLINLKNFKVADNSDSVYLSREDYYLAPGSYLVIAGDSLLLQQRNIPSGFIKSSFPALNNTGDKVILIDSLSRVIDSVLYSPLWGGKNGYSLERISLNTSSIDSLNWGSSINKYKGSPGYINSLSLKDYDGSAENIIIDPVYPVKGDNVRIRVNIKNKGCIDAEMILKLYRDTNKDSLPDDLISSSVLQIEAGDSILFYPGYTIEGISNAEFLYAAIEADYDQDTTNNYFLKAVKPGYRNNSIIINEVLYSPQNGESEWIELYNRSPDTINILNWSIRDVLTSPSAGVIGKEYYMKPWNYLIISSDTLLKNCHRTVASDLIICSIPNLNNDADGVILSDDRGIVIDSMFYTGPAIQNRSRERISSEASSVLNNNWGNSTDIELSTPGRINSITFKDHDLAAAGLMITPEYPCISDTIFISAAVANSGLNSCDGYNVNFFIQEIDSSGGESLLSSAAGNVIHPGETEAVNCPVKILLQKPLKISVYIDFQGDADTVNNFIDRKIYPGEKRASILINEIMYDPEEGNGEWIEIYNPTEMPQNLKNWSISDLLPSPGKSLISQGDVIIEPGKYIVIAHDSSLAAVFTEIPTLLIAKFGSLSSSADGIVLYDYRDGIIDSVRYSYRWGGRNGRSLERKSVNKVSSDSTNWTTSLSPLKATPGKYNSVSGLPSGRRSTVVINEVMYEPGPDNCEFIEFYNSTGEEINIGGWRIEDGSANFFIISDTSYFLESEGYFVFAADSLIFSKYFLWDNKSVSTAGKSAFGLSGSGELILLKDINGSTIDSLFYLSSFHNRNYVVTKNRSLERINPYIDSNNKSNWSTSTSDNGATPARENSVKTRIPEISSGAVISPNPFSPDNDGWEDFAVINYSFNVEAPQLRIRIYDNLGRLVRTLADNTPSGSQGQVIFDGRDDEGRTLRIGIYILYIEAAGKNGTETHKSAFVIARKL